MNGYCATCPDNLEIHDPIHVVSKQLGTVAIEENVTNDESTGTQWSR
jgi:hypothetical protein